MSDSQPPWDIPPPPPNPWETRKFQEGQPIREHTGGWPHRLLHVKTMTSHVKQGECTYNGLEAPAYNVISYTWGYYQDRTAKQPSLTIHGINWPIPSIKAEYFTPRTFHDAIRIAADGVEHPCEWIWVDVACIPQAHEEETRDSKELRIQEIGRQAKIFSKASEAFVWMWSLRRTHFLQHLESDSLVDITYIVQMINEGPKCHNYPDPISYLQKLRKLVLDYCNSWTELLAHPWFISLWTLQESKLRPEAAIILDDGLMCFPLLGDGRKIIWTLGRISNMVHTLMYLLARENGDSTFSNPSFSQQVRLAQSMARLPALQTAKDISEGLLRNLDDMLQRLSSCGFDSVSADFPNVVYSLARHRRTMLPEDRIYGIMQTYDINCGQLPDIPDEASRLQALEDDFGAKLIKKLPIVSQLFVHTMEHSRPRRSWLITNECFAADFYWEFFIDKTQLENHFTTFEVVKRSEAQNIAQGLFLRFEGKAWNLDCMVEVLKTRTTSPDMTFLDSPAERSPRLAMYRGLILDYHVSKALLGESFGYFRDLKTLLDACQKLSEFYCHGFTNTGFPNMGNHIQVALLGSSWEGRLPVVEYVGLVLAPRMHNLQDIVDGKADCIIWERVGLLRWQERYTDDPPVLHKDFPPSHNFQCLIR